MRGNWIPDEEYPDRVKVVARIRCVATGEIREDPHSSPYDDELCGVNPWWWSDGNAACDCNRKRFFLGDEDPDDDCDCSHGIYLVNLVNPKTGEVFYREFEE